MPFNELSEVEKYIKGLNEEAKQRLVSTITFMLINRINQQTNVDPFSIIQKMIGILNTDSQKQLLSEINTLTVKAMHKSNIDAFPIIDKLSATLNDENRRKIMSDINFVIDSLGNTNNISPTNTYPNNQLKTSNLNVEKQTITSHTSANDEVYTTPYGTNSVLRQTINGSMRIPNSPPPPPPPIDAGSSQNNNSLLRQTFNGQPPNPSSPSLLRQTFNGSNPNQNKATNLTGTFNLRTKDVESSLPVKETIKYIIPICSDVGKRALADFSTPTEIYQFLKQVNGINGLDNIYVELYPRLDIASFVSKLYMIFNAKYIFCKKNKDMPRDKDPKIKIGEWLVNLGYIEPDKLEKVVQLHSIAVKSSDMNSRRQASKTMINNQPVESKGLMFGTFLLESEIITKAQLEQALLVQSQFNEIINSLIS